MNSIWERVQIRRQTETIAPNYFILQNKNQLKPDIYLMLLRRSCLQRKNRARGKCKARAFLPVISIRRREESERSAEGQFK